MSFEVVYAARARRSLFEIADYISAKNPRGAHNVIADINATVELLTFAPMMGTSIPGTSLRSHITPKYRYRLIYRASAKQLTMIEIYHPRQNPAKSHRRF